MADKLFEGQFDDEEVLMFFRKHPIVMRKGLIAFSIGILLPVLAVGIWTAVPALADSPPSLTIFFGSLALGLVLGILLFTPSFIAWYFSIFIVTNQRFIQITQKGLFTRSVSDLGLDHIQSVNYRIKGIQETMLGFGTMLLQTMLGDLVIHDIHHPAKIQKELVAILRDEGFTLNQESGERIEENNEKED